MVEAIEEKYEIDPYEPIHVQKMVKPLTKDDVSLFTKPSNVVEQPDCGLKRLTCQLCGSIPFDAV